MATSQIMVKRGGDKAPGWSSSALRCRAALPACAPADLRLVYLLRYSPQLQPVECLWSVLDEPIDFETIEQLDAVVAERCRTLETSPDLFKGRTNYHWWPKTHRPN